MKKEDIIDVANSFKIIHAKDAQIAKYEKAVLGYKTSLYAQMLDKVGLEEPKKETIEEAAERLAYDSTEENKGFPSMKRFIEGAKWQAERMYSEEEVLVLLHKRMTHTLGEEYKEETTLEWFEQFKKK